MWFKFLPSLQGLSVDFEKGTQKSTSLSLPMLLRRPDLIIIRNTTHLSISITLLVIAHNSF